LQQLKSQFFKSLEALYPPQELTILYKMVIEFISKKNNTLVLDLIQEEQEAFNNYINQLKKGIPIQYVLGEADFYQLKFKVNEHVLIPRPETEELVYLILQDAKINQPKSIIDIGTGSGCIPITLKKHLPNTAINAIDVSENAIAVAKENALKNKVEIDFTIADALHLEPKNFQKFDVIVSNPPYIALSEMEDMEANVTKHEPHLALFVEDENPLIFYQKIADFALTNLQQNGVLYFEINQALAQETQELLEQIGFITEIIKDINQNDRMIKAQLLG
jgi:release factor glutamine methyltransferase